MIALYATIWLALIALLAGELGRIRHRRYGASSSWPIVCSAAGIALTTVHMLLALGIVYGWDHDKAALVTAQRAATVYGVVWPLSLHVNYLFVAWWIGDTLWWWLQPPSFLARPRPIEWAWRLIAFTMVLNGAVIFASPAGRVAGIPLTLALLLVWWRGRLQ